jgi:cytochrome c-type biogenesis protein CcmH/NrfG
MTGRDAFWFVAGLLSAVALLILTLPWLRARAAAQSTGKGWPRWLWVAVPAALLITSGLYAWLGNPGNAEATAPTTTARSTAAAGSQGSAGAGSMTQVVAGLEARLARNGGTDADWNLLAQSYEFLSRPADAALARQHQLPAGAGATAGPTAATTVIPPAAAPITLSAAAQQLVAEAEQARRKRDFRAATAVFARLAQMRQMSADTWADYADAQASLDGKLSTPQTAGYIDKALELAPLHTKALWLKASLEEETSQFAAAAQTFQKLVAQLPADSGDARLIRAKIAEDQKLAPGNTATAGSPAPAAANAGPTLRGEIVLADALRARVKPGMALFVFAKAVGAPGAPVAVFRTTTGSWPLKFELTNANAMLPGHDLSSAQQVVVEARISQSGQASAQPGDLQGSSAPLAPVGAKALRIVIQKIIS